MNTNTPETDDEEAKSFKGLNNISLAFDFARQLERERDEARAALSGRTVSCSNCNESARKLAKAESQLHNAEAELSISNSERDHFRRENAELHKAIREAYFLLAAFDGGAVDRLNWHNRRAGSLARLQPFIDHSAPANSPEKT